MVLDLAGVKGEEGKIMDRIYVKHLERQFLFVVQEAVNDCRCPTTHHMTIGQNQAVLERDHEPAGVRVAGARGLEGLDL